MASADLPLLTFSDAMALDAWLAAQPDNSPGAWLRFSKQGSTGATVTKSDAIDCALAHGWIDGQLGSIDATAFKTRFTPRKPRSAWSRINCQRAEQLMVAGRMTARGLAQVELAKSDGRWANAYEGSAKALPDAGLRAALDAAPAARAFFEQLDAANRYAVLYRVQQAKTPQKRTAKIAELVAKLSRGEGLHPRRQRRG
jgi:uncharacterized protein YdeI (YjbR/CyaY-like superfamily)